MTVTRAGVRATAEAMFTDESPAVIVSILDRYGLEDYEHERERVQLAILKLSGGDMARLLHFVNAAKNDYRDILWWAESPQQAR